MTLGQFKRRFAQVQKDWQLMKKEYFNRNSFWTYVQRLNKRQKLDQQINVDFASREGQDWEINVVTKYTNLR